MSFYKRYAELCEQKGFKPQASEMQRVAGVTSAAISGWKKGALPKVDVIYKLVDYFKVSADYLLCLSDEPNEVDYPTAPDTNMDYAVQLNDDEQLILETFRKATTKDRFKIIATCAAAQQMSNS